MIGFCAAGVLGISVAEAQETCVVCSGPAAVYRCTIEKADKIARFGSMADKAIQTVCIKEMARNGGHETCAVSRETAPAICDGIQRQIPLTSLLDAARPAPPKPATTPVPSALPAPVPTAASPPTVAIPVKPADPKDSPPRTVQELAERTGENSKKQLESFGEATSRTWGCVISLFKKC
ncbi:MAG: hypothetical protein ABL904_03915 [Hyphomicrobiaceae bacterium]